MRKKWWGIGISIVVIFTGLAWYANDWVYQKSSSRVTQMLSDPTVKVALQKLSHQQINKEIASLKQSKTNGTLASTSQPNLASTPTIHSSSSVAHSEVPSNHLSSATNQKGSIASAPHPQTQQFANRQQAIDFAMSRFTTSQILYYSYEYMHRSSLTTAQKDAIKEQILAHFTPQQISTLEAAINR